ncbi:MAG: YncE family protein [Nitrososphaerota archaeon]|nr:YncE family protein [Nitrososphaerota archaeon]
MATRKPIKLSKFKFKLFMHIRRERGISSLVSLPVIVVLMLIVATAGSYGIGRAAAQGTGQYSITSTITVATNEQSFGGSIAVNPATNTIYVTDAQRNVTSVINGATGAVTATVAMGGIPDMLAVDTVTGMVYVTVEGGNGESVAVIDGSTNSIVTSISTGGSSSCESLAGIDVDSSMDLVYVSADTYNSSTGNCTPALEVIDGSTNTLKTTIPGYGPGNVAVDPSTHRIYVTQYLGANVISVIDGTSDAFVTNITVTGGNLQGIAVNQAANLLYAAESMPCLCNGSLLVYDGSTNTLTSNITVQEFPMLVSVDETTNTLFVASQLAQLDIVSGSTNAVTQSLAVGQGFSEEFGIVVDSTTGTVYALVAESTGAIDVFAISSSSGTSTSASTISTSISTTTSSTSSSTTTTTSTLTSSSTTSVTTSSLPSTSSSVSSSSSASLSTSSLGSSATSSSQTTSTTQISNSLASSTTQTSTSSKSSHGGGGVPEFPFQFAATAAVTVLVVISYLLFTRRRNISGTKHPF